LTFSAIHTKFSYRRSDQFPTFPVLSQDAEQSLPPLLTKLVRPSVQRWTQPTVRTIYTNQNKPDSVDNVQRDLKNPGKSKQEVQKAKNIENEVESDSQNMSDKQDSFSREVPNLYQSDPIFVII